MDENSFRSRFSLPPALLILLTVAFFAMPAHAYDLPGGFTIGTWLTNFWDDKCKEDANHGLVERFILCTRMTVTNVFYYFIFYVYPFFENLIYLLMTFSIILFGVRMTSGTVENMGKSAFVLALKLGCVVFFTSNLDWVFENAIATMDGMLNLVSTFSFFDTGGRCTFETDALNFVMNNFGGSEWPFWKRLDCLLDGIIGLNKDGAHTGIRLSQGMMAFFIYCFASGLWGFLIFIMGLIICVTLVRCALSAVQLYLMCFIMLCVLTILGVMFIPLILFDNDTVKEMFKKWAITGLGYMIQPVLMFAFLSLLFTAFDNIMFSGTGSVMYALAGKKSLVANFNIHSYLETNQIYTKDKNRMNYFIDPTGFDTQAPCKDAATGAESDQGLPGNAFCLDGGGAAKTAVDSIAQGIDFKAINWTKLGQMRDPTFPPTFPDPEVNAQYNVAAAMIMAALSIFVFNTFMNYLPQIVGSLGGGGEQLQGNMALSQSGYTLPGESMASGAVSKVGSGISAKLGFR